MLHDFLQSNIMRHADWNLREPLPDMEEPTASLIFRILRVKKEAS